MKFEYPKQKLEKSWVQNDINDDVIKWSESFGKFLQSKSNDTKPLTTSQIRKFFGELKRIQASPEKFKDDVPLLKAKLAYAVGRDYDKSGRSKSKIKEFYDELSVGIDSIRAGEDRVKDLIRFVKIVESIVAYHKYFGGKDN